MNAILRLALFIVSLIPLFSVASARADGCYICGSGSSEQCKNYCRYSGSDTFNARKDREKPR